MPPKNRCRRTLARFAAADLTGRPCPPWYSKPGGGSGMTHWSLCRARAGQRGGSRALAAAPMHAGRTAPARIPLSNVGRISGGPVATRVPHEATADGEFRAFTNEAYQNGRAALLALAGPGEVHS